ncbi:aromatic ring-hydroxylating oxygenase subunit alpha [Pyruvatibacter mobilis]|jgi:phenylpropionate dioxygenase-like ring-hydroxylating dioxygenase large terminal subunit|uniref:Rieske 2Fe-2S domain-containing protein n=1 Tax=Pyruvatibacter mobilis TaxID=1712261 RepID=A0A845Q9P1_9HYPH|nr:aromatic ring-hydroxylating dioxygenase subunit alpha [Pyruvatibacter mobilis]NBG95333.1 Rieske 2Fe-2S domain-containing protein [Pyruvatibacter mobilis]QJD75572.1 aromatic ring-hydroxylating dioxygenase subunit alpha [Pyruvatibacter mobilis]GGD16718.1 (2Fe-2S) ferredoxin [Pyruvatibacter mobilis]
MTGTTDHTASASSAARAAAESDGFLKDIWYFAMHGRELKPGALQHRTLAGQPVLIGRTKAGKAFAIRDICPHRGVPLSAGRFVDTDNQPTVQCPYHGWRFGTDGVCKHIPSLYEGQDMDASRISVTSYPLREQQGALWVFVPSDLRRPAEPAEEPPLMPGVGDRPARIYQKFQLNCHVDNAVIGLIDPAHGPFVHKNWFWRDETGMKEKAKEFAPVKNGFCMVAHKPSANSKIYTLLGGDVKTEISFLIPGVRIEHITAGKHHLVGMTTVTPEGPEKTEITQSFFTTNPVLNLLAPLFKPFMYHFLKQDADIVNIMQEGLKFDPRLMLINEADVQGKWYFSMKAEWERSRAEGRDFRNPVPEKTVLRWRS